MSMHPAMEKILCPVDFSQYSRDTLGEALFLSRRLEAELTVLHVINRRIFEELERMGGRLQAFRETLEAAMASAREEREERLAKLVDELDGLGVAPRRLVRVGVPYETILETAQELEADLIVMGARGRGSLARQLRFGTSAEKVFRRASCRVLFVR